MRDGIGDDEEGENKKNLFWMMKILLFIFYFKKKLGI